MSPVFELAPDDKRPKGMVLPGGDDRRIMLTFNGVQYDAFPKGEVCSLKTLDNCWLTIVDGEPFVHICPGESCCESVGLVDGRLITQQNLGQWVRDHLEELRSEADGEG